ncbi:MAG TPA: endonuclease/exonuclease/phosphatase family protein [bacterium]|nr:endonuclease/exonuclease/phosphatase family protein [bacterium]
MKKYFIFFIFLIMLSSCSNSDRFKIATFNIRNSRANDGENSWSNRKTMVVDFIKDRNLAIIGMQEVLPDQYNYISENLPEYTIINNGRIDGKNKGEANPVLFQKKRFKLLDHSTFWLSKTPEIPGSKSWDAACPRIVTWVQLKDKKSGHKFYFFNTHFDHISKLARKNSTLLIIEKISDIVQNAPFILAGDFNCNENSSPYKIFTEKWSGPPGLRSSVQVSGQEVKGASPTFNGFGNPRNKTRIDHIFLSSGIQNKATKVHKIKKSKIFISDHYPVTADIKLSGVNNLQRTTHQLSFPLYKPYTKNSKQVFSDSIKIDLLCPSKNAKIWFTTDGSSPDTNSNIYQNPIILTKSTQIQARSFRNDTSSENIFSRNYHRSILDTSKNLTEIIFNNPVSPQYYAHGIATIIDKKLGSVQESDQDWLGFQEYDLDIVLDFGEPRSINKIGLSFLIDHQLGSFKPARITFLRSNNSRSYREFASVNYDNSEEDKSPSRLWHIDKFSRLNARYIRIIADNIEDQPDWKDDKKPAWLFIDEIIVE